MPDQSCPTQCLIQMDSPDPIWEWHVPSDSLFLSAGALCKLQLEGDPPRSMQEFLTHCPLERLVRVLQVLENVLCGLSGPHMECIFPMHDKLVRGQLLVVARDSAGRATRVVGSTCIMAGTQVDCQRQQIMAAPHPKEVLESNPPHDSGRLLMALNATGDGLWDWDTLTNEVYYSPAYLNMLGYSPGEFAPTLDSWSERIHPDDHDDVMLPQLRMVTSPDAGDTFTYTYRMRRRDGRWAWILSRGYVTHRDAFGRATRIIGLHTDISAAQGDRAKLEDMVRNDALTGLRSRTFYGMEADRLEQQGLRPVSIIVTDVNGLKIVNDYLGHPQGNALPCRAALFLRTNLSPSYCVARMSGDEFAVLMPHCSPKEAESIVHDLRKRQEAFNAATPDEVPTLLSIGCAGTDSQDVNIHQTLANADRAMLRHKFATRSEMHLRIKKWIENHQDVTVSLDDSRYN